MTSGLSHRLQYRVRCQEVGPEIVFVAVQQRVGTNDEALTLKCEKSTDVLPNVPRLILSPAQVCVTGQNISLAVHGSCLRQWSDRTAMLSTNGHNTLVLDRVDVKPAPDDHKHARRRGRLSADHIQDGLTCFGHGRDVVFTKQGRDGGGDLTLSDGDVFALSK